MVFLAPMQWVRTVRSNTSFSHAAIGVFSWLFAESLGTRGAMLVVLGNTGD